MSPVAPPAAVEAAREEGPALAGLSAAAERAGEVGAIFSETAKAIVSALSPESLGDAAKAVTSFVRDLEAEQVARAAQVAAPKTAFPMGLVLMVVVFLTMQNRIDRNDPKLALAPVHADGHLDFRPPRTLTSPHAAPPPTTRLSPGGAR